MERMSSYDTVLEAEGLWRDAHNCIASCCGGASSLLLPEPVAQFLVVLLSLPSADQSALVCESAAVILFGHRSVILNVSGKGRELLYRYIELVASVACRPEQEDLRVVLGRGYIDALKTVGGKAAHRRVINAFLALLLQAARHAHSALFSTELLGKAIEETLLYLDTLSSGVKSAIPVKERLAIIRLFLDSQDVRETLMRLLHEQQLAATRNGSSGFPVSPSLVWCLSYCLFLMIRGPGVDSGPSKRRSSRHRTQRALLRMMASTPDTSSLQNTLMTSLGEACMWCIERKVPLLVIDAFYPMLQSLSRSVLVAAPINFVATVTRQLRRCPDSSLAYFVRLTDALSCDLSQEASCIVNDAGLGDLLKGDRKAELVAEAQKLLAALVRHTSDVAVTKQFLSAFHTPLLGATVRPHEKLGYLESFFTIVRETRIPVSLLRELIAPYFEPTSYIITRGSTASEPNEAVRCKCLQLAGRFAATNGMDRASLPVLELLFKTLSDAKVSDKLRITALDALCTGLDALKHGAPDASSLLPLLTERLPSVLVPLVPVANGKPAARLLSLLSLLALLRIDRFCVLDKEKLAPAKLKRIFGLQDSFLNAIPMIAKGIAAEYHAHAAVALELLTPRQDRQDDSALILGLPLLSAHPLFPKLVLSEDASTPCSLKFPFAEEDLERSVDDPYGAFFQGVVALHLVGVEKKLSGAEALCPASRLLHGTDPKNVQGGNGGAGTPAVLPSLFPTAAQAGLLRMFALAFARLQCSLQLAQASSSETPGTSSSGFRWSRRTGLATLKSLVGSAAPGVSHNEDDTMTLLTFIAAHPTIQALHRSNASTHVVFASTHSDGSQRFSGGANAVHRSSARLSEKEPPLCAPGVLLSPPTPTAAAVTLVPDVSRFPALLAVLLRSRTRAEASHLPDPTGFRSAVQSSLLLLDGRTCSSRTDPGSASAPHRMCASVEAAAKGSFAVLLEHLQGTKVPDRSAVRLFLAPSDRCFYDDEDDTLYLQGIRQSATDATADEATRQHALPLTTAAARDKKGSAAREPSGNASSGGTLRSTAKAAGHAAGPRRDAREDLGTTHRTKAEQEQHLLKTQETRRLQIRAQLADIRLIFQCLEALTRVHPDALAASSLQPLLLQEVLRCMRCPLTAATAYRFTLVLASAFIPKSSVFSPVAVADALFATALSRSALDSKFIDALGASGEPKSAATATPAVIALLVPILEHICQTALSLPACTATLQFLHRQLSPTSLPPPVDLHLAVRAAQAAIKAFPATLYVAEPLLRCICARVTPEHQLVLAEIAAIGQHDDPAVRRVVVQALANASDGLSLKACEAYVHVFASDPDEATRSLAQDLLTQHGLRGDISDDLLKQLTRFFTGVPSEQFAQLAGLAFAHAAREKEADPASANAKASTLLHQCICTYHNTDCAVSHRLGLIRAMTALCRAQLVCVESSFQELFVFIVHSALRDPFLVAGGASEKDHAAQALTTALGTLGLEAIKNAPAAMQPVLHRLLQDILDHPPTEHEASPSPWSSQPLTPGSRALLDSAVALFFGTIATFAKPTDTAVKSILERLLARIADPQTPTRAVQCKIATTIIPLVKMCCAAAPPGPSRLDPTQLVSQLLQQALSNESFVTRNGSALALAASVKGLGIAFIKEYSLIPKLIEAAADKLEPVRRQGALLCFQSLSEVLGRLFEPYVVHVLGTLLTALSDVEVPVRTAAQDATKTIMSTLSAHGVKLVLPNLMGKMEGDAHWRTQVGSIEALGAMAHCAPKQLAAVLPQVVPQLCEAATHSNRNVKQAAADALETVASVVTNQEIKAIAPVLLTALQQPGETAILKDALDALLHTTFVGRVDAPSLSLVCPIVVRALRERSAETKRKATAIVAAMVYLCSEPKDFFPYFGYLCPPLFDTLVDPIPDVRAISAKALGTIARVVLDEDKLSELLGWLLEKLKSSESSVERSGAAHGLSEVLASLGVDKLAELLPGLLSNAEHAQPEIREGYLGLFVFLPSSFGSEFQRFVPDVLPVLLRGLSSDVESFREVAFRAAEVLVSHYAATHSVLLLTPLENGIFSVDWRIRYSSISLLGTLVERLLRCETRFTTETEGELEVLSVERRAFILSTLYMVRCDDSPVVRQQAAQVWKTVVQNTPKTLKEILPILLRRIVGHLAAPVSVKQEVAANCIGDLSEKFPERVAPELMPQLIALLQHANEPSRYGGCIGLSQALCHTSRTILLPYSDSVLAAVQKILCDTNPSVRDAATQCLAHLVDCFGGEVLTELINSVVQNVLSPPTYNLEEANDPLRSARLQGVLVLFETHHQIMLQAVIPACSRAPYDIMKVRLIMALTAIRQPGPFAYALPRLFPTLISTVALGLEEKERISSHPSESSVGVSADASASAASLSLADAETLVTESVKCAQKLYTRSLNIEGAVPTLINLLYSRLKPAKSTVPGSLRQPDDNIYRDASAATLITALVQVLPPQDLTTYLPTLLRYAVPYALTDSSPLVVQANVQTLSAVTTALKQPAAATDAPRYITVLRETVGALLVDPTTGKERKDVIFIGLNVRNAFDAFYALYHAGCSATEPTLRELAARGLADLINHCPTDVLKPIAVKITGPFIRATVERTPPSVKAAMLATLRALIVQAGPFLRPLVPQLQIAFCKTLADPALPVRRAAAAGFAALVEHPTVRIDPLVLELCSTAMVAQDTNISVSLIQGITQALRQRPALSCSVETTEKLKSSFESILATRNATSETLRTATSECLACLLGRQVPADRLASYLQTFHPTAARYQDLETLQTVGMVLSDMLLVEDFRTTLAHQQPIKDTFVHSIRRFLNDDRLGVKRYGVILYSRLVKGSIVKTGGGLTTIEDCFQLLPLASDAIGAFVDLSGVPTLLTALKSLKALAKHNPLPSMDDRLHILNPTVDSLTLAHPAVKLLAEKVLYYAMNVHDNQELHILDALENPAPGTATLDPERLKSLGFYTRRVLSKMQKDEVSSSS